MDRLDQLVRAVTRAVHQRLGQADPEVVRLIARELLEAAPAPVGGQGEAGGAALQDNGDGTVTTGLGSVVPRPQNNAAMPVCVGCVEQDRTRQQNRAVITATGANQRGVIAQLSAVIAELRGDIQDLSQTIVSDFFTLIVVVDINDLAVPLAELKQRIGAVADKLGIHAVVMHESVMHALQRV